MRYAKQPGGRHAPETGSLTVAELLARRGPAHPVPSTPHTAPSRTLIEIIPAAGPGHAAASRVPEPSGTPTRHRAAYRFGRTVAAAGLTALAVGSLGAAALLGAPAPERPSALATAARTAELSGTDALRPDIVAGELGGVRSVRAPAAAPAPGPVAAADVAEPEPGAPTPRSLPADPAAPATPGTGQPPVTGESAVPLLAPSDTDTHRVVRDFFTALPSRPQVAMGMLDPVLAAADPGFTRAWRGVRAVEVLEVAQQDDGRVLASVVLEELAGGRLHTTYLLTLSGGEAPRIVDAHLVSAQRG